MAMSAQTYPGDRLAYNGPATSQFFAVYDPGGYLGRIFYPPGGARQYVYPGTGLPQGNAMTVSVVAIATIVAALLLFEHARPK